MTVFSKNASAIAVALSQIYVAEGAGAESNPQILQYAKDCGFKNYVTDDTAWCSLFMNWIALKIGITGTMSLRAKSWLTFGEKVITEPSVGDIAVFWRGAPEALTGHVGLYINEVKRGEKTYLRILGGNQSDQVKISEYPKEQLLEFRRWV